MSPKWSNLRLVQNTMIVVKPAPLDLAHQSFVRDELFDIGSDWSVDLHGVCSEETTLILLPDGGDDAFGPSFVISRESFGYRLNEVHWDEIHDLGLYPELANLVEAIRTRLTFTNNPTFRTASLMLH